MAEILEVNFETKTLPLVEKLFDYNLEQLKNVRFTLEQLAQLANTLLDGNEEIWNNLQDKESEKVCSIHIFSRKINELIESQNLTPDKLEQFWKTRLQLALILNPDKAEEIQDFLNNHSWENDKFELNQLGTKIKAFIEKNRNTADRTIISEILKSEDAKRILQRPLPEADVKIINTKRLASCLKGLNETLDAIENFQMLTTKQIVAPVNAISYPILNRIITCASCGDNEMRLSKHEFNALKQEWMKLAENLKPLIQSAKRKPTSSNIEESCVTCSF